MMANKEGPVVSGSSTTLQRGKACLRCRKRKMRCDGSKPACQQCTRAGKADLCEYDDGKGKTRTQLLRENIARLEQRIRELEDPEYTSPSVILHDPHAHQRSSSSSSSFSVADSSPGSYPLSSTSPFPPESASSPSGSWGHLTVSPQTMSNASLQSPIPQGMTSPSPIHFENTISSDDGPIPLELANMFLDIFESHRHQCGLAIHPARLRQSLTLPIAEQRHPVLMNVLYLWACYFSRPGPLSQHEAYYIIRTVEALHDALQYPRRVLDVLQALSLLSLYFLSNGRMLEGSTYASTAACLAMQWGLNGGISTDGTVGSSEPVSSFVLDPPVDRIEEGERILVFWQVYNLDRCWSVILHKPATIPDVNHPSTSINVPWPLDIEDYESGQSDEGPRFQTIRSFFDAQGTNVVGGFSILAMRVKASALFERADKLAAAWDPRMPPPNGFTENCRAMEVIITRFISTLVPVQQLDAATPEDKRALLVIHSLAQAALIHLYYRLGRLDQVAYDRCLKAARCCVGLIKHISDADYEFLDPVIGPCWTCAVDTLFQELSNVESNWPLVPSTEARGDLATIFFALNILSARFPFLSVSVTKIQNRLSES